MPSRTTLCTHWSNYKSNYTFSSPRFVKSISISRSLYLRILLYLVEVDSRGEALWLSCLVSKRYLVETLDILKKHWKCKMMVLHRSCETPFIKEANHCYIYVNTRNKITSSCSFLRTKCTILTPYEKRIGVFVSRQLLQRLKTHWSFL